MQKIIITILALLSLNCNAEWANWSDLDKKLFVASQIAIVADWSTTRYGTRHYNDLPNIRETNIIIGSYPSTNKVDLYCIALLVSNYYIADNLSTENRTFYLSVRTLTHGIAARHNVTMGWQMRF